ncbi:MAG: glycosyltransferase family 1 protein [Chlorobiaceae bacterium]|nr:glycosyltransferase family 1 protein [Chlorobiaceae bacterium]NTV60852.1 glycosyltransferase family 1 protein [Chlorobiaceae bacterium]
MKTSILYAGLASPHVGWLPIDELAELLARYFQAEILSPRPFQGKFPGSFLRFRQQGFEPLPKTSGGDVLIVVARGPNDLSMINAIPDCRKKFGKIYGFVTDSYFQLGFVRETFLFDAITVTAHEDVDYPKTRFGIPVHQLYQGADCLTWAPREPRKREIDLISFGRTPPSYQNCFSERFHPPGSPYLYLHSPLGNITGPGVHLERGMLMKLLHRTRISLAFHLFVEPQGDRPRSMMVTSRWLESLLSGCIVAGRRPVSRMADDMLFWPGSTLELSEDPETAADELVALLRDNDNLEQQRYTNIFQTISHHDWRYRIDDFCRIMNLPVPGAIPEDLQRLRELGALFRQPV